jgi:hypothetical protein
MDKILFSLLISPSLLLSWEGISSTSETKEFYIAKSDDRNASSRGGRDDSRGPRGDQNPGRDMQPQVQQPQSQPRQEVREVNRNQRDIDTRWDSTPQIQQNVKIDTNVDQQIDRDRSPNRRIDQKQDVEVRNAPQTIQTEFRDGQIPKERIRERENRWQSKGVEWRKNFYDNRTRDHVFDDHFWDNFRRRNNNWYFDNNYRWYSSPNWSNIVIWLPWQWKRPIYYYYDNDNIYYSTTEDYTSLIPVDSKEQFIAQAVRIANGHYPISTQQSDWMPLGMFTIASDNDDMPKRYLSLAISKQGAVTGAYFDAASNTTLEIQGGIDPESQRIAWKFVGKDWPIMESGLYNLTKEESTLLIHTSSSSTKTELLIKLNQ